MKKILITGASGGIGRAISSAFADPTQDVLLCLHYRHENPQFKDMVEQLEKKKIPFHLFQADFKEQGQIDHMISTVLNQIGNIDLLVNNAGCSYTGLFHEMNHEQWLNLIQVNLTSVISITKAILPGMIQKKQGNIINISSIWGITGASCEVAYSATKSALIGFSKALASEVGPCGIRVNCIAPGIIATPMNSQYSAAELTSMVDEIPLQRLGNPEEIAGLVRFLASNEASYITGQCISPNGGLLRI